MGTMHCAECVVYIRGREGKKLLLVILIMQNNTHFRNPLFTSLQNRGRRWRMDLSHNKGKRNEMRDQKKKRKERKGEEGARNCQL